MVELAKEYGAILYQNSEELWTGRCPHPDHDDKTPSFRIYYKKNNNDWTWTCFGCHTGPKDVAHGNFGTDCFAFVQWMTHHKNSKHPLSFYEAAKALADRLGLKPPDDKNTPLYKKLKIQAESYNMALSSPARKYLYARGLDNKDIQEWLIGSSVSCEKGKIIQRISFPLFDAYSKILGFSSRIMPDDENNNDFPKYRNSETSEVFNKSHYLYGAHKLDKTFNEIRITEGVMDVILSSKYGVKNIVCTLGTAFTRQHVEIIKNSRMIPVLCMDADEAGQKAIKRIVALLAAEEIYSKVFIVPEGKDMADLALSMKSGLEEYIELHSMSYWEYMMKDTVSIFDSKLEDLRRSIMPDIIKASEGAMTDNDKILMKSFVKERFGINL